MDRMERRDATLQAFRRAQEEHAHLHARADELASAYHDIRRKMRDSGEHDRRVAEYKQARSEFYAKKNDAYETSQRKRVPWRLEFLCYLVFFLSLFFFLPCVLFAVFGLSYWPIIVLGLSVLGAWMMLRRLSVQEEEATRAYKQMKEPDPTAYRLTSKNDGGFLTDEEDAALRAYHNARYTAEKAESAAARAQETYDIACMTPEEETAYWAKKRYEIALEQRDRLARIELEVEMAQDQASEAAEEAREAAEEQKRLLGDQTDELERLREEVRRLRDK